MRKRFKIDAVPSTTPSPSTSSTSSDKSTYILLFLIIVAGGFLLYKRYIAGNKDIVDTNTYGRFVRISKSSGFLEINQIQCFDSKGNLLEPFSVQSSRPISDPKALSSKSVIDGNLTNVTGVFMTGTPDSGNANSRYLTVDYGQDVQISKINIYPRIDCCRSRIAGSVVDIANSSMETVFISNPLPTAADPDLTTTVENTKYSDRGNDLVPYNVYSITLPNKLPIGIYT